jgi:hypothetical protein
VKRVSIEKTTAYRYAVSCTDEANDKVGRYIKKQAVKWLEIADGKSETAFVSENEWGTHSYAAPRHGKEYACLP